jgi:ribosomal protein L37AE/L43A
VKGTSLASRHDSLVCPLCEVDMLRPSDRDSVRCKSCGGRLSGPMLETLRRISALPNALGSHACECGHPEMRLLPDGVFHCPACGSEVLPINVPSTLSKPNEKNTSGHSFPTYMGLCSQDGGTSPLIP